jgi:pimeloyl-ACP methyl ester carboxylesterase
MGSAILRVLAWLAALPYLAVAVLVVSGIATWSAVAYVVAMGVLLGGLATLPREGEAPMRRRGFSRIGAAAILLVAIVRAITVGDGKSLRVTDGQGASARLVSRFVDEADVSVAAARTLVALGMLRDDAPALPSAMRDAYEEMRREEGATGSPVLATNLGLQGPSGFDLLVLEPRPSPRAAVVFLHGSAGGFAMPCWRLARALAGAGVTTACPSTRWAGDWESADGEATVRHTVELLRARGVSKFVLVGLSAGGIGASQLAPRMKGVFAGLVLVSGADPAAAAAGVPTLVLHGRHDTMVPADHAAQYVLQTGARYVELDAGHFALLVRAAQAEGEIRAFVEGCLEP